MSKHTPGLKRFPLRDRVMEWLDGAACDVQEALREGRITLTEWTNAIFELLDLNDERAEGRE